MNNAINKSNFCDSSWIEVNNSLKQTNSSLIATNASLIKTNEEVMALNKELQQRVIELSDQLNQARVQNNFASTSEELVVEKLVYREATTVYGLNKQVIAIALASTAISLALGASTLAYISLLPLVTVGLIKAISDKLELTEGVQAYMRKLQGISVFVPALLMAGISMFMFVAILFEIFRTSGRSDIENMNMYFGFLPIAKEILASSLMYNSLK